jgi:hypothetical protein
MLQIQQIFKRGKHTHVLLWHERATSNIEMRLFQNIIICGQVFDTHVHHILARNNDEPELFRPPLDKPKILKIRVSIL